MRVGSEFQASIPELQLSGKPLFDCYVLLWLWFNEVLYGDLISCQVIHPLRALVPCLCGRRVPDWEKTTVSAWLLSCATSLLIVLHANELFIPLMPTLLVDAYLTVAKEQFSYGTEQVCSQHWCPMWLLCSKLLLTCREVQVLPGLFAACSLSM